MHASPPPSPAFAPPHIPIRPAWIEQASEPVIEPDIPIVDAHHHLWDRPDQRYMLDELLRDTTTGHDIRATVFVQCRSMYRTDGPNELRPLGETEFVNGIAAQSASGLYGPTRACAAIVGYADLTLGAEVASVLEAHLRIAPERFRGIRCMTAFHPSEEIALNSGKVREGLLMDTQFRRGFAELAPFGLSYDVWAFHTQLHEVLDLARQFPDTSIVINHVGGPLGLGPYEGRRDEVFTAWRLAIQALAACANVTVKLGGLGMHFSGLRFHERPRPPSSAELAEAWRPYIATCIEAFGPERCMFESNFSVDKGMTSYPVLWNAFKRLATGCTPQEKEALFRGTATRVYRLQDYST